LLAAAATWGGNPALTIVANRMQDSSADV